MSKQVGGTGDSAVPTVAPAAARSGNTTSSLVKQPPVSTNGSTTTIVTTTTTKPGTSVSDKYKSNIPTPLAATILEEDDYTQALSQIIERDFFPEIAKLKRQHSYLDALKMNDLERIQAAAKEIRGNDTPLENRRIRRLAETPKLVMGQLADTDWTPVREEGGQDEGGWKGKKPKRSEDGNQRGGDGRPKNSFLDTPGTDERNRRPRLDTRNGDDGTSIRGDEETGQEKIDTSLSLDQFQSRYTSEDNASFNEIMDKINEQRKQRYKWIYETERKQQQKLLTAAAVTAGYQENSEHQQLLITDGNMNHQKSESDNNNDVSAMILAGTNHDREAVGATTWAFKARNSLMYFPEGVGSHLQDQVILAKPKEIVHRNTGFQGSQDLLILNQKATIDPTPYLRAGVKTDGSEETPNVNGYRFVSSTPTPHASDASQDEAMMTWGTIEDTPLLISSGVDVHTSSSPFRIPDTPRRELIAQKLSDKASKSFREKSNLKATVFGTSSSPLTHRQASSSSTPKFTIGSGMGRESPFTPLSKYPTPRFQNSPIVRGGRSAGIQSPRARADMLSPAAKSLLNRATRGSLGTVGGGSSRHRNVGGASKGAGSIDMQLRDSYNSSSPRVPSTLSTPRK